MKKLFLSYSSKDRHIATPLKQALETAGYEVWFDQNRIAGGSYYADEIPSGVKSADVMLILCTANSMGDHRQCITGSREILKEFQTASNYGKVIIPLKADDTSMQAYDDAFELHLSISQWIDIQVFVKQGRFDDLPQLIEDTKVTAVQSLDEQHLKDAANKLKRGDWGAALTILQIHPFRLDKQDEACYLKQMALMLKHGLRKMSKNTADALVQALTPLLKTDMASPAAYSLAILSRYFYQANGMADPTAGFDKLLAFATTKKKVKAKYKLIAKQILPVQNSIFLDWNH